MTRPPRVLRQLRFVLDAPPGYPPPAILAGANGASWPRVAPPHGRRFCDVEAGGCLVIGGGEHRVTRVEIADADPPGEVGRAVTSGRAWLRGE